MTAVGTDLGVCGVLVADGYCDGRLIVDRESGGVLEAVCSACGQVAARPASRLREESVREPDRERMAF